MHALFEYLPLVIFFVFYKFGDLYWATGSLIVTSALQILYYLYKKQPVPKRNWIFFGLIALFGGLTIFLQDDSFIKWKVTVINAIFALALLISNHVFNKNLIKDMMGENLPLPENIWGKLNFAWAMFFLTCAILNIYIASNYSQETWVNFKVFGLMGLTIVFAIVSVFSLYKYLPQDDEQTSKNQDNQ
ncbi:putative intracellular septation protein A [Thalassotalea insulae]|uniref:Inner membrane-spanning protein YciB n=1 Tax=Thalassotalea insulae TaxID=2056778 RepID=A0ABQ6GQ64_9GAMM|nr:septation protein A [Thalassotalea insulae]GLX76831.1 putative intracellular septation protein A [Thalassotalea insulae]